MAWALEVVVSVRHSPQDLRWSILTARSDNFDLDREARGGFESRGYETRGGYAVREPLDLPTEPPFTAHIGNLSFEATAADVTDLFADCGVTNVRIVEDRQTNTPKGFGYIEFETVAGLQKALDLSGTSLMGRTIRTSVADPRKFRCLFII
jgi:translation initiation factor 4B